RCVEYRLGWAGREHILSVTGSKPAFVPNESSDEHFFKEHRWGYGITRRGRVIRYEVTHPAWQVFPVQSFHIELDWVSVYGPEWSLLTKATPMSTVFADRGLSKGTDDRGALGRLRSECHKVTPWYLAMRSSSRTSSPAV